MAVGGTGVVEDVWDGMSRIVWIPVWSVMGWNVSIVMFVVFVKSESACIASSMSMLPFSPKC